MSKMLEVVITLECDEMSSSIEWAVYGRVESMVDKLSGDLSDEGVSFHGTWDLRRIERVIYHDEQSPNRWQTDKDAPKR